jgi:esterase/lipase superfamily enzyme/TRAP-type C4-dicarboxylate transport system substrate-binding protein
MCKTFCNLLFQMRLIGGQPVAWAASCLIAAKIVAVAALPAQAQPTPLTITVLIESSFQGTASRFLEEVRRSLAPEVREAVRFETLVKPAATTIPALLGEKWDIAILSTTFALTNAQTSAAAAFEMPFIFPTVGSVIALQRSHIGQVGLSAMSAQGMTGLVYLNGGVTLVAGKGQPQSPDDLKGRKVAVFSSAQEKTFEKIGSVPLALSLVEAPNALKMGAVDSVVINSGSPESWVLPERGFLLANSVKAQVAVVVTQDSSWGRIPFVYRARIGDAAVIVSERFDQELVQTESSLFNRATSSGVSLVTFQAQDASRATRQWITEQPEALRGIYSSVYDYLNLQSPRNPLIPRRGGQVGKLYFATTRDDTGDSDFGYRFGDTRTGIVKCGQIEFSTANPSRTTAAFLGRVTADSAECGTSINTALQSSKRMLIFVHGFNNRFSEAAERAMALKNALGSETEVLLWSWPSKRDGLVGDYRYDKESVEGTTRQSFVRFLRALKGGSNMSPLHLLAHSMGSWHAIGALQVLSDEDSRPVLQSVVLAAPDVPRDDFILALDDLSRVTRRPTLYACEWDWALLTSRKLNAYPRAGSGGDRDIVADNRVESIDVDATWSANHSYVFQAGKVLSDLSTLILTGMDADARGLTKRTKAPWHYWRFHS